jgi:hypothetical protein
MSCPRRVRSARAIVVLPVPTSPVQDDHALVPARGVEQLPDGVVVRLAEVEKVRVGASENGDWLRP